MSGRRMCSASRAIDPAAGSLNHGPSQAPAAREPGRAASQLRVNGDTLVPLPCFVGKFGRHTGRDVIVAIGQSPTPSRRTGLGFSDQPLQLRGARGERLALAFRCLQSNCSYFAGSTNAADGELSPTLAQPPSPRKVVPNTSNAAAVARDVNRISGQRSIIEPSNPTMLKLRKALPGVRIEAGKCMDGDRALPFFLEKAVQHNLQ